MKALLQRIRLMRLFSKMWPLCCKSSPEWTPGDAAELRTYFQTTSGRKLIELMRYHEQASNSNAVLTANRAEYTRGWAAGQRGAFAWFFELSRIDPEDDPHSEAADGAEEFAERNAP